LSLMAEDDDHGIEVRLDICRHRASNHRRSAQWDQKLVTCCEAVGRARREHQARDGIQFASEM
jgi:hypothetical protein